MQTTQLEVRKLMLKLDAGERMSLKKRARLMGINRSALYYKPRGISDQDHEIMKENDRIYLKRPYSGSRRLQVSLRRLGFKVGRHHIRYLMRKMRIQTLYPKKRTSIPNKDHKIYPYLLRNLTIDRPNQVWCTDITYIPMAKGFFYLVIVMDWHSRFVLSWCLSTTLDFGFCIEALNESLHTYDCPEIFNSDQGAQFTSGGFISVLSHHRGIKISMDGKGRVFDNIFIERLWRSLKQEEVYLKSYESVVVCRKEIGEYFDHYNNSRPHQSLNYLTPNRVYHDGLEKVAS